MNTMNGLDSSADPRIVNVNANEVRQGRLTIQVRSALADTQTNCFCGVCQSRCSVCVCRCRPA